MPEGQEQQKPTTAPSTDQGKPSTTAEPSGAPTPTPTSQPDILQMIPENYRSNPKQFFDEYSRDREWAEYGRKIAPHQKTFQQVQQDWEAFQQWRQSQSKPATKQPSPSSTPSETQEPIDWTDPDQVEKAYRRLESKIEENVGRFTGEFETLRKDTEESRNTLFELLRIQQELRDVRDQELYQHVKFEPQTEPQKLAQFMLENNLNDVKKAHEFFYGSKRLEKKMEEDTKAAYERGKKDMELELASRRTTTESTPGTPWRIRQEEGPSKYSRNSEERKREILQKMSEKIGVPIS
jgi:hypothetical protein